MDPNDLLRLARQLVAGECTADEFTTQLSAFARDRAAPLDNATVDVDRARRCGFPEVIYGPGKTPATIVAIAQELLARGQSVLATRIDAATAEFVSERLPQAHYNPVGR